MSDAFDACLGFTLEEEGGFVAQFGRYGGDWLGRASRCVTTALAMQPNPVKPVLIQAAQA